MRSTEPSRRNGFYLKNFPTIYHDSQPRDSSLMTHPSSARGNRIQNVVPSPSVVS